MQPVVAGVLDEAAPAASFEELSGAMCRAQGPSQALVVAATAASTHVPSLVCCSLAVAAHDRQSVRFNTLYARRQGAARLAAVAVASCAAGIAIDTKQVVHVRDILVQGDLGLHDLQYLQQEHQARSCFVAPLVVAGSALGALSVAASQPDAFVGHEAWLQAVAALCAPYVLLLKSHQGLLALEGLASQTLPVRVAMQLQDQQRRGAQDMDHMHTQQQQVLPLAQRPTAAAGGSTVQEQHDATNEGGMSMGSSSLRQLRAAERVRQRQLEGNITQANPQPVTHQPMLPTALQAEQQQPQQQLGLVWSWRRSRNMTFQQPHLEQAFRQWCLRQWICMLDSMFVCLVLLSAFSGVLTKGWHALYNAVLQQQQQQLIGWQADTLKAGLASLLLLTALLWLLRYMQQLPAAQYLPWRRPVLVSLRVLRTLYFCVELWRLAPEATSSLKSPPGASIPAVASSTQQGGQGLGGFQQTAVAAGVGLLLMLGLLGQLPSPQHAAVQGVSVTLVLLVLLAVCVPTLPAAASLGGVAAVLRCIQEVWVEGCVIVLVGWVLPVVVVAAVEWFARKHFLETISN